MGKRSVLRHRRIEYFFVRSEPVVFRQDLFLLWARMPVLKLKGLEQFDSREIRLQPFFTANRLRFEAGLNREITLFGRKARAMGSTYSPASG